MEPWQKVCTGCGILAVVLTVVASILFLTPWYDAMADHFAESATDQVLSEAEATAVQDFMGKLDAGELTFADADAGLEALGEAQKEAVSKAQAGIDADKAAEAV